MGALVTKMNNYITSRNAELTRLDTELANNTITQAEYDQQHPVVLSQRNKITEIRNLLVQNKGAKRSGNFESLESLLLNNDDTMNEITRSLSKTVPSECIDGTFVEDIFNNVTNSVDELISLVDFDTDMNFEDNLTNIQSYLDSLNGFNDAMGAIKDAVTGFIDNIRSFAEDVQLSGLKGSPCADALFNKVTSYKNSTELSDINNLRNSDNIADVIFDKIESIKIR